MPRPLRTVDLARAVGLSPQQVRNYEAWGFLPLVPRSATGYRLYGERHLEAMRTARVMVAGYGWPRALEAMQALHRDDLDAALAVADARHAELDRERREIERTLAALRTVVDQEQAPPSRVRAAPVGRGRLPRRLRISEVARRIGVRVSAVRFWEQQGLLRPERDRGNRYRLYDDQQLRRVQVVALLRQAGYRFEQIRAVVEEVAEGRLAAVLRAAERRRASVAAASRLCAQATAALWRYAGEAA
ncbi:MAG TPA: MerR family transcriptional regulator [Chloroflexota bacterium]|nr:MerR family transcriptional regulator [Chloroflexota bacterium]